MRRTIALLLAVLMLCLQGAPAAGYTASVRPAGEGAANAVRAAAALNGTVLLPGERFSFLEAVGSLTEAGGYTVAPDGTGTPVPGGGIAQTAALLVQALSGLPSGTWSMDVLSFYGGESPDTGLPPVRVDAGTDLQFTNLSAGRMGIQTAYDGTLTCTILLESGESAAAGAAPPAAPAGTPARGRRTTLVLCGSAAARHNAVLAANSLYELTLGAGDVFSFNAAIGSLDSRFGYQPAEDGRGQTVQGGGVDQAASLLWLALQQVPEVSVLEKNVYGSEFTQGYVASSGDAIRTDPEGGLDFVFRYNGQGTLTLYLTASGDALSCDLALTGG